MIVRSLNFFREVWEELSKVTWPTRAEAIRMTITVLVASAIVSVLIGGLDFVLANFMARIISRV